MRPMIVLPMLMMAACSGPKADEPAAPPSANAAAEVPIAPADNSVVSPTAPAKREADYVGRWIGVEGSYLVVASRPAGGVSLEMQYDLDNKGTFDGTVQADGIRFERGGESLLLRPSDGDATGLRWLAGKKNCLTVASGEGYCRD